MNDLLLRSVTLPSGATADVLVRDGRIDRIGAVDAPDVSIEDCSGGLLLPGFVDAHCHVDKTLLGGPWVPNSAGPGLAPDLRRPT